MTDENWNKFADRLVEKAVQDRNGQPAAALANVYDRVREVAEVSFKNNPNADPNAVAHQMSAIAQAGVHGMDIGVRGMPLPTPDQLSNRWQVIQRDAQSRQFEKERSDGHYDPPTKEDLNAAIARQKAKGALPKMPDGLPVLPDPGAAQANAMLGNNEGRVRIENGQVIDMNQLAKSDPQAYFNLMGKLGVAQQQPDSGFASDSPAAGFARNLGQTIDVDGIINREGPAQEVTVQLPGGSGRKGDTPRIPIQLEKVPTSSRGPKTTPPVDPFTGEPPKGWRR